MMYSAPLLHEHMGNAFNIYFFVIVSPAILWLHVSIVTLTKTALLIKSTLIRKRVYSIQAVNNYRRLQGLVSGIDVSAAN